MRGWSFTVTPANSLLLKYSLYSASNSVFRFYSNVCIDYNAQNPVLPIRKSSLQGTGRKNGSIFTDVAIPEHFPEFISASTCPRAIEDRGTGWSELLEGKNKKPPFRASVIPVFSSCPVICPDIPLFSPIPPQFVCSKAGGARVWEISSPKWISTADNCFSLAASLSCDV